MGGEFEKVGTAELRSALSWWLEAGVDVATEEEPRDWLNPAAPAAPSAALPAGTTPPPAVTSTPPAETFEAFRDWLRDANDLPFAAGGAPRIMPVGSPEAEVMLLTGMPSLDRLANEGPIDGEAWVLVQRMIAAIGIDPAATYRASLSCFHSLSGLAPSPELDACIEMARRHIALVKPRRLLLLGDEPSRALLGKPLAAARGHVQKIEGVRTVATFHPSFLIMHPLQKEAAWSDLLLLTEDQS